MAKTTNPLFSIAATGSVGPITYQQTTNGAAARQVARTKPTRTAPDRSAAQQDRNAKFKTAALAWSQLDTDAREHWLIAGYTRTRYGRLAYIAEHIIQMIEPPDQPKRPAPAYIIALP